MLLTSCGISRPDTSSQDVSSANNSSVTTSEVSSSSAAPSSRALVPLAAPVLSVNESLLALTWTAVEGAASYSVTVDSGNPASITTTMFELVQTVGNHSISIVAVPANNANKANSDPAVFAYEVKNASIGELSVNNNEITWASSVGLGVHWKKQDGQFSEVTGNKVSINGQGAYTIRALTGYDATNKILYVSAENVLSERTIVITNAAEQALVLEDASERTNSGLQEKYTAQKYTDSWQTSSASLSLDESNGDYTDGKCIKINFWHHGAWFKFSRPVEIAGSYSTLKFFAKGGEGLRLSLSFEISKNVSIGSRAVKGVYMSYIISNLPDEWTEYNVNFNDENWTLDFGDGTKLRSSEFLNTLGRVGIKANSLKDFLPYFDTFQIRTYAPSDSNGSNAYVYLDEVKLDNSLADNAQSSVKQIVRMKDRYAVKTDAVSGFFVNQGNGAGTLSLKIGNNNVDLPVTYTLDSATNNLTLVCTTDGYQFNAVMSAKHNGADFELVSVDGPISLYLANAKMASYGIVDDFESYAGTGTGYDANHTADQKSGLRGAYYADYYSGSANNPSPVGGANWSLMGSNDYLELNTDAANVHSGAKSARFKYNKTNDMRFISFGLSDGTATALPEGSYLSFWTKGVSTRVNKIKIKVYNTKQVTASNQTSTSLYVEQTFEIPQNSDWMECKVPLKAGTVYYGFSIHPLKNNGDGAYFFIDDITVYNSVSPWGE